MIRPASSKKKMKNEETNSSDNTTTTTTNATTDDDDTPNSPSQHTPPRLLLLSTMTSLEPLEDQDNWNWDEDILPVNHEWTWVDPAHPTTVQMTWKRLSLPTQVPPDPVHTVGGHSGRMLVRHTDVPEDMYLQSLQRKEPQYHATTLWGNTFCQGMKVGLASYHFGEILLHNNNTLPEEEEEEDESNTNNNNTTNTNDNINSPTTLPECYISYEHPATGQWPPLDNGMAIPARVPFRNVSFDPTTRIFRGHICWLDDFGTAWNGMVRWEYEIHLDDAYTCIVGGQVLTFREHGSDEGEELSRYGEALVYVNARLWEVFRQQGQDDPDYHYPEHSRVLRQALLRQGASVRTIAAMHSILTAAQVPEADNPIDYNL